MAVNQPGVPAPLISLGYVGNRHRLKPRPPVADGPLLAGTMIKAPLPRERRFIAIGEELAANVIAAAGEGPLR